MALIQHDYRVLYKREHKDSDMPARKKNHVEMKAEIGVLPLQAQEHQGYSANHKKQGKRLGTNSSTQSWEETELLTLSDLRLLASTAAKQLLGSFTVRPPSLWYVITAALVN